MKNLIIIIFFSAAVLGQGLKPEEIYKNAVNSIFYVVTKDKDSNVIGTGSAVYIEGNRLVTNYHVISEAIHVYFIQDNDTIIDPDYYGIDPENDLAVFYLQSDKYKALPVREYHTLKVGETVFALGNPNSLKNSFSEGIISGLRNGMGYSRKDEVQFTAGIFFGSSGGALLDCNSNMIGITSKAYFFGDIYFAIPTDYINNIKLADNADTTVQNKFNLYCKTIDFENMYVKDTDTELLLDSAGEYFRGNQQFLKLLLKLFIHRSDNDRIKIIFQNFEKDNIGMGEYYCLKGQMYECLSLYDSALYCYSRGLLEVLDEPELYIKRAGILAERKLYKEAIEDYEKAICLNEDLYKHRFDIADMYLYMGDTVKAEKQLEMLPYGSSYRKAKYYIRTGNYENAVFYLTSELKYSTNIQELLFSRAVCYSKLKKHSKALADYFEYLKYDRFDPGIYNNMGYEYLGYGEFEEAERYFKKALEYDKKHIDSYLGLTILSYRNKKMYDVNKYLYNAVKINKELEKGMKFIRIMMKDGYYWDENELNDMNRIFKAVGYPFEKVKKNKKVKDSLLPANKAS